MKKRYVAACAAAALAAALYVSPYVSQHNLQKAAEDGDPVALADHVDFPSVRESLKGSLALALLAKAGPGVKDNPFAALTTVFATSMSNALVEVLVTPRSIATLLTLGKALPGQPSASAPASDEVPKSKVERGYKGWDRFEVKVTSADGESSVVGTLRRENLFFWKLKHLELQLPK